MNMNQEEDIEDQDIGLAERLRPALEELRRQNEIKAQANLVTLSSTTIYGFDLDRNTLRIQDYDDLMIGQNVAGLHIPAGGKLRVKDIRKTDVVWQSGILEHYDRPSATKPERNPIVKFDDAGNVWHVELRPTQQYDFRPGHRYGLYLLSKTTGIAPVISPCA